MAAGKNYNLKLIVNAVDNTKAVMKDVTSGLDRVGDAAVKNARSFTNMGTAITGSLAQSKQELVGVEQLVMGLGVALVSVGTTIGTFSRKAMFRGFIDEAGVFEHSMQRVQSVLQTNEKEFTALADKATELGAKTEYTASQVADGMKFLAMTGYNTREVVSTIAPMLDLAAASSMELAQAADYVTNIMMGFDLPAEQAVRATDVLSKTAASANTNIVELAEGMKFAAPVARMMGMSIEEASSILGVLADNGIKATLGGTALRRMLLKLADPSRGTQKTLQSLNVEVARNADGNVNLVETLERLKDAQASAGEMSNIFGLYAVSAAAAIQNNLTKVRDLTEANNNAAGSLDKMVDIMRTGLVPNIVKLRSAWNNLLIAMGTPFIGIATKLVKYITDIISAISDWAKENPTLSAAVTIIIGVLSGFLVALGSMIMILAQVAQALGSAFLMMNLYSVATGKAGLSLNDLLGKVRGYLGGLREATVATKEIAATTERNISTMKRWSMSIDEARIKLSKIPTYLPTTSMQKFGDVLAGGVVYTGISALSGGINSLDDGLSAFIQGSLFTAIYYLATSLPKALSWLASYINQKVIKAVLGMGGAFSLLGAAVRLVGRALLFLVSNVWGILIVGALAWIKVIYQVATAWNDLKDVAAGAAHSIADSSRMMREALEEGYNPPVGDYVREVKAVDALGLSLDELKKKRAEETKALKYHAGEYTKLLQEGGDTERSKKNLDIVKQNLKVYRDRSMEILKQKGLLNTLGDSLESVAGFEKALALEGEKGASALTKAFSRMEKDIKKSTKETADSSKDLEKQWIKALGNIKEDLKSSETTFTAFTGKLNTDLVQLEQKFTGPFENIGKLIEAFAKRGKTLEEWENLRENIERFGEQAATSVKAFVDNAKQNLDKLQSELTRISQEIKRVSQEANEARYQDEKRVGEAITSIRRRGMTDEQKYYDIRQSVEDKLAKASQLAATNEEANIKRAQQLRRDAISEAQQLSEVKNKDQTIISQTQANEEAVRLIKQAQVDLAATTTQWEQIKTKELEKQRDSLKEQIMTLTEIQGRAQELANFLQQQVKMNLDTTDANIAIGDFKETAKEVKSTLKLDTKQAEKQLAELGKKGQKVNIGDMPVGMASGGTVPGIGLGDKIPAMLTPGEFVMPLAAVRHYGLAVMEALRSKALGFQRFASGGLADTKRLSPAIVDRLMFLMNDSLDKARQWAQQQQTGLAYAASYGQAAIQRGGAARQGGESIPTQLFQSLSDAIQKNNHLVDKGITLNIVVHKDGSVSFSEAGNVDMFG
jgi:TP901 family phage tail tape measure protein